MFGVTSKEGFLAPSIPDIYNAFVCVVVDGTKRQLRSGRRKRNATY
jgi:hypothetical protein